jgi:hypothetical protein
LLSTLKKYHNKPFEHYEKLNQIGGNNRATGAFTHSGGRGKGKDKVQLQPIAQSSRSQPITESVTQPISQSTAQPITRPTAPSNDDNDDDDDDDARSLDRDIAAALSTSSLQKVPPFLSSGPFEAPILELTPEAIWRMAPEVARSLLGLRGDDDTPMDIESIREIMQRAPGISQQPTVSSDAASTSQFSSISGGGRNSGKRKRTADDERVVGKASIQPGPSAKRSVSAPGPTAKKEPSRTSRKSTAALPSMLVSMSGAANNITTSINHMMMFQDNSVSQSAASIIQNIDYLSEDEQADLVLYFGNRPSVASTLSTLSPTLLERTLRAALQDINLRRRRMEQGLN